MTCTLCPLHVSACAVCINGVGEGPLLVVGAMPGAEEDLLSEPFVGPAGTLLRAMLADAGFAPDEYRLTYTVRCHTPKNRPPLPNESAACRPYLVDEIRTHKPTAIVALGDIALQALCRTSGIASKRGQPLPLHATFGHACDVFPVYNPAFVLRVPGTRATVVGDLRNVRNRLTPQTSVEYVLWNGRNSPKLQHTLAYDIETYDETGAITESMTQIAISDGTSTLVSNTPGLREQVPQILNATTALTVVSHLGWDFDDAKTGLISDYDTAALAYLDDETQPLGLEALCTKYLGVRGWKEARDGARLGTPELAEYNARDAAYTIRLYHALRERLGDRIRINDHILRPLRRALDECTRHGIYIDAAVVEAERANQHDVILAARHHVDTLAQHILPEGVFDVPLKTKVRRVAFNPGSTLHVGRVYEALDIWLPKTEKGKQMRTDEETLRAYAPAQPFTKALLEWRGATKRMSTYIEPYAQAAATPDHRIHPHYTVIRTLTGRTSSQRPNAQNLVRDYKGFFAAPPGGCLVRADYEALEFWVAVWSAGITRLIELRAVHPEFDPHRWFAARLFNCDEASVTKEQRQIAKSAHFGLLYLGTCQTLIDYAIGYGIILTRSQATHIYDVFHQTYPEFHPWFAHVRADMLANGYVESPTGRRRHVGDARMLRAAGTLETAHRECVNALVQGFATGDIAELGLIASHERGLPICGFIHDEILFEFANKATALEHDRIIKTCMIAEPVCRLKTIFNVDFPQHLLRVDISYLSA